MIQYGRISRIRGSLSALDVVFARKLQEEEDARARGFGGGGGGSAASYMNSSPGPGQPHDYEPASELHRSDPAPPPRNDGPHPLDLPSDHQGRALSALASGRWTVRPGSGRLSSTEPRVGPPAPTDEDLAGELRARDWIAADGAVTLVGRQALLRWCETAENEAIGSGGQVREAVEALLGVRL